MAIKLTAIAAFVAAAACVFGDEADSKRPYEIVRARRTADEFPPVTRLETADGWRVECIEAEAEFTTAKDHALFGKSVTRLRYRGAGSNPVIRVSAPEPIAVPDSSDTVSLWVRGNNVFGNTEYDPPYEKVPCVRILADFADASGKTYREHIGFVFHKDWHQLVGVVTNGTGGTASLPAGLSLTGLTVTGGVNRVWRSIDLTSLCVYRDPRRPVASAPRAKRGVEIFPSKPQGQNTGKGRLPFPTRKETVIPPPAELPRELEFRFPENPADWDGLEFRYAGSRWIKLARGGGILPRRLPEGAKVTFVRKGNSLVCDVVSPKGGITAVHFGNFDDADTDASFIAWPYYALSYYNAAWDPAIPDGYSRNYRPRTAMVKAGGRTLFVGATFDWTQSNATTVFYPQMNDVTNRLNSGVLYEPKTDGRLNGCFERFVWTFSEDVGDVLPAIPNPVSPYRHIAGSHSWSVWSSSDRRKDAAYWRKVKAAGIDRIIINDHETQWRDDNESFTFRTECAPRKGGDEAQKEYTRILIGELGFKYGPYNNFTDYAPVNAYWSIDNVARRGDGRLRTAWNRCYAPRATWAVGMCEKLAPIIQRKFGFNTAYCDVHTAVAPWSRTDCDARAPGAGTFAQVFYCYGEIMLLQKAAWGGPVYSEGGMHWMYCGLTDGNYARDPLYDFEELPWLVDFDLKRLHPLCCNFGMGNPGMFYGRHGGAVKKRDAQAYLDRFTAATLAFGHPGYFIARRDADDLSMEKESYFPVQAIAERYTLADAVEIRYGAADGSLHSVSAALANGAAKRSQLRIVYSDGTVVAVNGSWTEDFRVEVGGKEYVLPPNGWRAESADRSVVSFNGYENGRRAKYAYSPHYRWENRSEAER